MIAKNRKTCLQVVFLCMCFGHLAAQVALSPQAWLEKGWPTKGSKNPTGPGPHLSGCCLVFGTGDQKGKGAFAARGRAELPGRWRLYRGDSPFRGIGQGCRPSKRQKKPGLRRCPAGTGLGTWHELGSDQEQRLIGQALAIFRRSKDKQRLARAQVQLGWSHLKAQEYPLALRYLSAAQKTYQTAQISDPYWQCRMHCFLYTVYDVYGWMKSARAERRQALVQLGKVAPVEGLRWSQCCGGRCTAACPRRKVMHCP